MDFINAIVSLLQDPMAAIQGWIAAGPLVAYGFISLIVFIETGAVFMPFLPGDSLLFAAGFFAQNSELEIFALLACVWVAAVVGDQCNFMIGHFLGRKIIDSGKIKALTPERIAESEAFMEKWGGLSIFLGRFFPFIRTFVPFLAGIGGMRWHHFFIFNLAGGITWSTLFTMLGFWFGNIPVVQEHFELLVVGIVLVSVIPAFVGAIRTWLKARRTEDVVEEAAEKDAAEGAKGIVAAKAAEKDAAEEAEASEGR